MARQYPDLALKLSLRHDGHEVSPDPAGLASAFPDASHKIAAFVHGLCETDASWRRNAQRHYGDPSTTYGSLLQRDLAYTPLYVVYNSGMHVSDNGRQLSAMMDEITTHWPVSVDEIALIGHSMGGLVARSACHYAHSEDRPWAASVAHVVCLGTPHLGAPLEKAVHTAAWLAGQLPETRPVAKLLNARSAGVKDLCFGACVEEDWRQCHPDELLRDRCTDVPFLPHATYYFVAASVTTDPAHPIGALIGDLLVRVPSASGRGRHRRIPFEIENGSQVGRFHHFDLLNHPAVYQELLGWFETARPRRAGAAR
jgi:pimeloyl-ACP methyl ester carboxylesterase